MAIIKIEDMSITMKGTEIISRTIVGNFDIGDGIQHAFQITLLDNDLIGDAQSQKTILKQKIKDIVSKFKTANITTQTNSNLWNETYSENV